MRCFQRGQMTTKKAKTVYTYLINTAEYQESEDDQSMAGIFWKNRRCVPGTQALPSIFWNIWEFPCIYVEGSTAGSTEGHAWNIILLDGITIILMPPTGISRNFWKEMRFSLQNTRRSCMIICVPSQRNMR